MSLVTADFELRIDDEVGFVGSDEQRPRVTLPDLSWHNLNYGGVGRRNIEFSGLT